MWEDGQWLISLCSLCLCGEYNLRMIYHEDTKDTKGSGAKAQLRTQIYIILIMNVGQSSEL
jgi:hypothetical protein